MSVINQFLADVQWGDLDYLMVDMPPGTSDELLSVAQLIQGPRAVILTLFRAVYFFSVAAGSKLHSK